MVPINVTKVKLDLLSRTFGCSKGSLPFTYLGLPLRLTKPKVEEFLPLVNRCDRRLVSTSSFLSQAGRLELTNLVVSSLTFFMGTLSLPVSIINQIDKYMKHYLWRRPEANARKPPKSCLNFGVQSKEKEGGLR
jgi:hypothetical protein